MDCIFCQIDRAILLETKLSQAFFDGFPISHGHALVIPKRHVPTIWELSEEEYIDLFKLVKEVKELIQDQFEPQGINLGANFRPSCGANRVSCSHSHHPSVFKRRAESKRWYSQHHSWQGFLLGVQSRSEVGWIASEAVWLICPSLTDRFVGR
jgi:diadenosine tetraphosphate (Ap4A) HIT family hydrolase